MKRLNIKLAVSLLVGIAVLCGGVHLLHAIQVDRNAEGVFQQAKSLYESGELEEAYSFALRYLNLRDQDIQGMKLAADIAYDTAQATNATRRKRSRAFAEMERAVRLDPTDAKLRRKLLDFYVKYGYITSAIDHVNLLRDSNKLDTGLELIAAKCYMATGDYDKAAKICQTLVGYDPVEKSFSDEAPARNDADAYAILAALFRERKAGSEAEADHIIEQMVAVNEKSSKAHLAAHAYWKRSHNDERAKQALGVAYQLDAESPDVVLPMAEQALEDKNVDEAQRLIEAALEKNPDDERLYHGMAVVELRRRKPEVAVRVLKQGLEKVPESEALLNALLGLQLDQGDVESAKATFKTLKELVNAGPMLDYYQGRFLVGEKKWPEAIEKLTQARRKLAHIPQFVEQIDTLLGQCYQVSGDLGKALDAYEGVTNKNSSLTNADLGVAQVLAATGKNAEALRQYEAIYESVGEKSLDMQYVWRPLMQLRAWDQLRQPKEKRDWSKVEALVNQLKQAGKLDPTAQIALDGDLLVKKGDFDGARALYARAISENPNHEILWMARIDLELETAGPDTALQLAEHVPAELQDGLLMRLERAAIFARIEGEGGKTGLLSMEKGIEKLSANDRYRLLQALVQHHRQRNDRSTAKRLLAQIMTERKNDQFSRGLLFEIAREEGDIETMKRMVGEIARLADPKSPHPRVLDAITKITHVGRAALEIAKVKPNLTKIDLTGEQQAEVREARKLLMEVVKSDPTWNEPHKWLADIDILENNPDGRLEELRAAASKGPLEPFRMRQLYDLLVAKGQNAEADDIYKRLSPQNAQEMGWSQVGIMIQGKRFDEARKLLDSMQPKADAPVSELLSYADARRRINDLPQAETALRQALQSDPASGPAWVSLVNTLVIAKKPSDAEAAIQTAKVQLPADERELVLAQCYEAMRDLKRAEQSYVKAVADKPRDLVVNQSIAGFYLRANKFDSLGKYLDVIAKEGAEAKTPAEKDIVSWGRRARAVVIASDQTWQSYKEAERILLDNEEQIRKNGGEPTAADLLLRIALLANRSEPSSLRAALVLFEELQNRQPLTTNELVNLARLYERVGNWTKAKEVMLGVLAGRDPDPMLYLAFAEMLMRNGEYSDVDVWLGRYDRIRKDGMSLPIRVTLRVRQNREKEAVELIAGWLGPPPSWSAARKVQIQTAAALLENLRQYAEAEKLWRAATKIDPDSTISLAKCIGMYRDIDEAFSLLEGAAKFHTPQELLLAGSQILRARKAQAQDKHFQKLGGWYNAARAVDASNPQLELILGDMWEMRGQLDKAEAVYRKVLARTDLSPTLRAGVANNLAFILSTQQKNTDEAVKLIDDAMNGYGPSSDLLDTRGVVYLAASKPEKALADFQEAILVPSAMKWVHLAFAQHALKDQDAARTSLKKAQDSDLKREDLYEAEWARYERLARELGTL